MLQFLSLCGALTHGAVIVFGADVNIAPAPIHVRVRPSSSNCAEVLDSRNPAIWSSRCESYILLRQILRYVLILHFFSEHLPTCQSEFEPTTFSCPSSASCLHSDPDSSLTIHIAR